MTPIKCFLVYGLQIWVVDFADQTQLVAVTGDKDHLDFIVDALAERHKRPVIEVEDANLMQSRAILPSVV
jgi:hypothetical protein